MQGEQTRESGVIHEVAPADVERVPSMCCVSLCMIVCVSVCVCACLCV